MAVTFNIDGRHFEVTPALEAHVHNKMQKIEKIVATRVTTIHIILSVEKIAQKAEAEVKIAGDKNIIFAEATSDDMYRSIDMLVEKLHAQVLKFHGKLTNKHDNKHNRDKG